MKMFALIATFGCLLLIVSLTSYETLMYCCTIMHMHVILQAQAGTVPVQPSPPLPRM